VKYSRNDEGKDLGIAPAVYKWHSIFQFCQIGPIPATSEKSRMKSKNYDLLGHTVILATLLAIESQPIEIEKLEKSACLVDALYTVSAMVDLGFLRWEEGRRLALTDDGIDLVESFEGVWNSFQRCSRFLPSLPEKCDDKPRKGF